MIYRIAVKQRRDSLEHIKKALLEGYQIIGESAQNKTGLLGIPTGFKMLDKKLSGLQKSQLIIIAGRPGMGKTSFALNIAQNVAVKHHIPVAIFSLEMSREQLALRMLCAESLVDSQKMRNGGLTYEDFEKLRLGIEKLSAAPIYIDDSPTITVLEMLAKARRLKKEAVLGLIVIDYLQLMTGKERRENASRRLPAWAKPSKIMAEELGLRSFCCRSCPAPAKRDTKRLCLTCAIGQHRQDADVVLFIHRESIQSRTGQRHHADYRSQQTAPPATSVAWRGEARIHELSDQPGSEC